MNKVFLLFPFILLSYLSKAQTFRSENKLLTDGFVAIPATQFQKTKVPEFYISATEITNKQYREFLKDLRKSKKDKEWQEAMVDSSKWQNFQNLGENQPFVKYYFQDKTYDEFPVVNISKRGAELYCQWLTEKYNAKAKHKVKFTIPSEAQWMVAAKGGTINAIYPWEGNSLTYDKRGKFFGENMCNYRLEKSGEKKTDSNAQANITAQVISYIPNNYGLYNMSGNVAELIADKDYTKGGSWNSKAEKVKIESKEDLNTSPAPSPVTGFRPVFYLENQ